MDIRNYSYLGNSCHRGSKNIEFKGTVNKNLITLNWKHISGSKDHNKYKNFKCVVKKGIEVLPDKKIHDKIKQNLFHYNGQ